MGSKWLDNSVNTKFGIASTKNGELLVSRRDLTVTPGFEDYKRNNYVWMRDEAPIIPGNPPFNSEPPSLVGTPQNGLNLSISIGSWADAVTFAYEWYRDGVVIAGQTGLSLTLTAADVNKMISAKVTATNDAGSTALTTPAVGPVLPGA